MAAPQYPPPYAPSRREEMCESRPRDQEECLGQSRIPGLVILALVILMAGIFAVVQWTVERAYGGTYSGVIWPIFAIAVALLLIGVWVVARSRAQ